MLAVRDANRQLDLKLPEDDSYTTLAGFLMAQAGRVLEEGETVEYEGLQFKIERMDKRRIRRVGLTFVQEDKGNNQLLGFAILPVISSPAFESLQIALISI